MNVAVIGASNKPDRYSFKALMLLKEKGHMVYPVHKRIRKIEGLEVFPSIDEIKDAVDTVTLYVSSDISSSMSKDILGKSPSRIIFNPGAENPGLASRAREQGIETLNTCTILMLKTGRF